MAVLKDSLVTGDLRVTGTIYGNANLSSLNASGTGIGIDGQILTSTGTGLAWADAASSHSHSQYVLKAGDTVTGTLILSKTQDLSGTANNKPALIVGGADTAAHMEIDANEIQGKTNGTSVAGIYINNDGGLVTIGSGGLASTATTDATSSTAAAVKSAGGLAVGKKIWVGSTLGASSNNNTSSQLIISSSDTGAGGNVALELWRGTNASWQLSNEGGNLHFRTNYTTAKQTTYSVDAVSIAYNSGNVGIKGTVTAPTFSGALSGTATNANNLLQNTRMDYAWNGVNYFNISAANQSAAKVNDTPSSSATWWHILRFNHANSTGYYTDLAIPFNANSLYYKRIAGGNLQNSTINGGWVKIFDELQTIPIANGGTGATTADAAWTALGGGASGKHADSYFAKASHGNHVPATQTANNAVFLRNDNTWQTVTPANIGAATSGHTHTTSLASDTGTSTITLASAGKYKLTAGGTSVIFTMPTSNNYSHPTGDGNKHVPATGTTNNNKFLKAGSTAGSLSWTTIASVSNEILTIVS